MRQLRARPMTRTAAEQRAHLMREIVETLLFVGLVFVIVHFTVQTYRIPDASMKPQLQQDELVVVNKAAYILGGPSRGDVVVFYDPTNLNQQLIERVIAVPGDTVAVTASEVQVNGVTLNEPYVSVPAGVAENSAIVPARKLGKNDYFIMNDSRLVVTDSRTFGPVNRDNIVGKAVLVFWPLKQLSGVSNYSGSFSGVNK